MYLVTPLKRLLTPQHSLPNIHVCVVKVVSKDVNVDVSMIGVLSVLKQTAVAFAFHITFYDKLLKDDKKSSLRAESDANSIMQTCSFTECLFIFYHA